MPKTHAKSEGNEDEKKALLQQVAELTEALQRERADVINVRRRHDEQIANMKSVVKASVIRDLLPVIDNFERALKHVPETRLAELVSAPPKDAQGILKQVQEDVKRYDDFVKGIQGVIKQFEKTLADLGVEKIKTLDEPFDPKYHEAISMDTEGEGEQEIVSEELQSGYKIGNEVIRHAMVRVKLG